MDLDDSSKALLMLDQRDRFHLTECEEIARRLEKALLASFRFAHMTTYKVGTQRRHIIHFDWQPTASQALVLFSLIPGATATLGFDQIHPFAVDEALVLDWQDYCFERQRTCARTTGASARDHRLKLEGETLEKAFAPHSEQIEKDPLLFLI